MDGCGWMHTHVDVGMSGKGKNAFNTEVPDFIAQHTCVSASNFFRASWKLRARNEDW